MSYSFGWWDYIEGSQPALLNRYTNERIIRRGALAHGAARDGSWLRFDYQAPDLTFPLAIMWAPELGRIDIDYNLSMALWRAERGADADLLPFGCFARVDGIVPDALWCWPGVLDLYFERSEKLAGAREARDPLFEEKAGQLPTVFRLGGWLNGEWRPDYVAEDVLSIVFSRALVWARGVVETSMVDEYFEHLDRPDGYRWGRAEEAANRKDFLEAYELTRQRTWRESPPKRTAVPQIWKFVGPTDLTAASIQSAPEWATRILAKSPDATRMKFVAERLRTGGYCAHASCAAPYRLIYPSSLYDGYQSRYWLFRLSSGGGVHEAVAAVRVPDTACREPRSRDPLQYFTGPFLSHTSALVHVELDYLSRIARRVLEDPNSQFPTGVIENEICDYINRQSFLDALFAWPLSLLTTHARGGDDATLFRKASAIAINTGFLGGRRLQGRSQICYLREQ